MQVIIQVNFIMLHLLENNHVQFQAIILSTLPKKYDHDGQNRSIARLLDRLLPAP